jgi:hypothetical protein
MADMDNLVANPAHPGQDIKDGTAHYVKFAQINNPITDTHWIWVTDGGKTDRLWTNDAKSTAVDGMSVNVYINKGALVKIIKTGGAWFVKDVIIPAVSQGAVKAILSDGSIPMATGYAPANDQDIATKKYVADNAGSGAVGPAGPAGPAGAAGAKGAKGDKGDTGAAGAAGLSSAEVEQLIREFRVTVAHNIADHAKPTAAECATVFKTLPHFDWTKDDDFYIKDSTGGKLVLIKYRATPAATEAAPGNFFYEILTLAA